MKVLLYAVFKDHEGCNYSRDRSRTLPANCSEVRSLKAEQCSTLILQPLLLQRTTRVILSLSKGPCRRTEMVDPLIREPAHRGQCRNNCLAMNLSRTLEMSDRPLVRVVRRLTMTNHGGVYCSAFSMASSVVDLECTQLHSRQT